MKKILLKLGLVTAIVSPIAAVVSCGNTSTDSDSNVKIDDTEKEDIKKTNIFEYEIKEITSTTPTNGDAAQNLSADQNPTTKKWGLYLSNFAKPLSDEELILKYNEFKILKMKYMENKVTKEVVNAKIEKFQLNIFLWLNKIVFESIKTMEENKDKPISEIFIEGEGIDFVKRFVKDYEDKRNSGSVTEEQKTLIDKKVKDFQNDILGFINDHKNVIIDAFDEGVINLGNTFRSLGLIFTDKQIKQFVKIMPLEAFYENKYMVYKNDPNYEKAKYLIHDIEVELKNMM